MQKTVSRSDDLYLDLYPNGAYEFNLQEIRRDNWPNNTKLPGRLNLQLTEFIYELLQNEKLSPVNRSLHSLFFITGVLTFNVSFYNLAHSQISGGKRDESKPLITFGENKRSILFSPSWKDVLATRVQKIVFLFLGKMGFNLNFTTLTDAGIYNDLHAGWIWRLRRPQAIPKIEKCLITDEEKEIATQISQALLNKVDTLSKHNSINLNRDIKEQLYSYILGEITETYRDLKSFRNFFRGAKFSYFERSLTPYYQSLISTVCRENNGQAYSTFHGVCQTANEPDISTMINATVFCGATHAFTLDAEELALRIPKKLHHFSIENLRLPNFHFKYLKDDPPRRNIKRIAIMGRQVVMRTSAFNTLEFPVYLDLEYQLSKILIDGGFEVIYKAHPESNWMKFGQFFDERVQIDKRPFEEVFTEFDAVFYHFGASSTLPHALGSNLHLFMLKDGWHDTRIWPSRIQKFFQDNCNYINGKIMKDGFVEVNPDSVLESFLNPRPFDRERRIKHFFSGG